ncbi:MAG: alpha/beta fold hydrolase, partial [Anaerolineae bacterium]
MRPYKLPRESLVLDDVARDSASGAFVRLSDGMTHYRYAASQSPVPSDVPVVLIHGFSVPSFVWEPTFQGLVNAGFSVLC